MTDGPREEIDDQRQRLTLKDVWGQVWLLLPAVMAGEQLVRLSGGNTLTLLALSSAVDIKSLLLGILLPSGASVAVLILALHRWEVTDYVNDVMRSKILGIVAWLAMFGMCSLYIPWYYAAFAAVLALLSPLIHPYDRNRFLLLLLVICIFVIPTFSPSWIPPELLKVQTGQRYVAYVVNPDQAGWTTILTVRSPRVIRFRSSTVVSREICDAHPKSFPLWWVDAYPAPIIQRISHHTKITPCPHI